MEYPPAGIEKYLRYMQYFGNSSEGITPENSYDFEYEHQLVAKCEAGGMLSIIEPTPRESE